MGNRPNVLEEILVGVRADVAARQQSRSLADVKARAASAPSPLDGLAVLRAPGVGVVAELKRRSPSRGQLANIDDGAAFSGQTAVQLREIMAQRSSTDDDRRIRGQELRRICLNSVMGPSGPLRASV